MKTLQDILPTFHPEVLSKYNFSHAEYHGALTPITNICCPEHGAFKQYSAQLRKNGAGCPSCGAEKRVEGSKTLAADFFKNVSAIHGGKYDYSKTEFVSMNRKITVTCPQHGDFTISANHHYYRKQGCGACETENRRERIVKYRHLSAQAKVNNTAKDFFARCLAAHNDKYAYPDQEYRGAKVKIRVVCPEHGEFRQAAWAHLSGKGCPQCGAYTPKWEQELSEFIQGLGFEVLTGERVLYGREIDVLVPCKNIGFELHGLRWHTERTRSQKYHREKWQAAKDIGVQLVQIFEDEWTSNRQVILDRVKALLGVSLRYDARKTLLGVVPRDEAHEFFDATHSQGASNAQVYYGLRFNGSWVAVASFGRARSGAMVSGAGDTWEVIRYASTGRVRGGFSKLFKNFIELYQPERVVSYCDLRYGDGRLYAATGFVLDGVTDPDYWWVPNGKIVRVPRYQTQKHKLSVHPVLKNFYDPTKTEVEICHAAGWYRIYGVGHQRWVWNRA